MTKRDIAIIGNCGISKKLMIQELFNQVQYSAVSNEDIELDNIKTQITQILLECYGCDKMGIEDLITDKSIKELNCIKNLMLKGNNLPLSELLNPINDMEEIFINENIHDQSKKKSWKRNKFYEK